MSPTRLALLLAVLCAGALPLAACRSTSPEVSNAASLNCVDKGGQQRMEDQLGLCVFPDERQCEQWAMLRGDCPRGGIPVSGYSTAFERHCAIRGGSLLRGTCALPPAGTYVAKMRDDRLATLTLDVQGGATLALPFPGRETASITRGAWARNGNFLTVFSGKEEIVFRYEGQRLVARRWDRDRWGGAGLEEFRRQ